MFHRLLIPQNRPGWQEKKGKQRHTSTQEYTQAHIPTCTQAATHAKHTHKHTAHTHTHTHTVIYITMYANTYTHTQYTSTRKQKWHSQIASTIYNLMDSIQNSRLQYIFHFNQTLAPTCLHVHTHAHAGT